MNISRKGAKTQRKACLIVRQFKKDEAALLCVFAPLRETQTNITKVKP
jgi:hypothetical protein